MQGYFTVDYIVQHVAFIDSYSILFSSTKHYFEQLQINSGLDLVKNMYKGCCLLLHLTATNTSEPI